MSSRCLPLELTCAILDEISEDKKLLLRCRLVCKDFQDLATPHAFRTLNISRKRGCYDTFTTLLGDVSRVFAHVKEINFRALERGGCERGYVFYGDPVGQTASIFSHITEFSNLRSLRLFFPDVYEEEIYDIVHQKISPARHLQIEIFKVLAALNFDVGWSAFRELEVHGLLALPNKGIDLDGFKSFLNPLTKLHISVVSKDHVESDAYDDEYTAFWETNMTNILAATENLTALTLICDINTVAFYNWEWAPISLPKLQYLLLKNVIFTNVAYWNQRLDRIGGVGVEEFIIRHKESLIDLNLSSCWADIDADDPHPRSWANIWNNFEQELTRLRSFKFDPLPGRAFQHGAGFQGDHDQYNGYVAFVSESGFLNYFDDPPQDEDLDKMAFKSLQLTIARRNEPKEE